MHSHRLAISVLAALLALVATACSSDAPPSSVAAGTGVTADDAPGVRVVPPAQAHELLGQDDVVVLDVRTPQEFAEGHLAGAILVDFQAADFADRIAELDRDASYVLYCRSGNRSAQARALMDELGFRDVADVDGGILSWTAAGLPVTTG